MHSKIVAIAAVAALAEQASAYNHNRHSHNLGKRALETVFETVWETVYVTEGQETVPTQPAVNPVLPIITSTSVIVVPSSQAPPPAPAPTKEEPAPPPPAPTTEEPAPPPPAPTTEEPAPPAPTKEEPAPPPPAPTTTLVTSIAPEPTKPAPPPTQNNPVQPGSSNGVPSKRGMAYNSAGLVNSFRSSCKSCSWAYNWGSSAPDLDSSISYVPMLWGEKALGHWHQDAEAALSGGAKALLSFNEPDHADQANMSPAQAAAMHKEHMDKYSGRALIGSPAVTNGGGDMGVTWLKNFFSACDAQGGCAVDFCAVHWYSEAQYADTLLTHLEAAHEACGGRPIWLTEFAPLGDDNQKAEFMKTMIPKLDALDYLHAYSYFWVDTTSLMTSESSLSSFGSIYASI